MIPADWAILNLVLLCGAAAVAVTVVMSYVTLPPASLGQEMRRQRRRLARQQLVRAALRHVIGDIPEQLPRVPAPPAGRPDPRSSIPPLYLYHGTDRGHLLSFMRDGLLGRTGGWAFMAPDIATARGYARGNGGGIVFRVLAQRAYQNGVFFEDRGVYYVARQIHPGFIDFRWSLTSIVDLARQHAA